MVKAKHLTNITAVFMGSKSFGLAIFRTLQSSYPSISWHVLHPQDYDDQRSVRENFAHEAQALGATFHLVSSRADAAKKLASIPCDLGFVCGWYWLLGRSEVGHEAPPLYGIHNSLLPTYRGGAPLVWAIIDGVDKIGSTLFRLSPGMDDGPIVTQVHYQLKQDDTIAGVINFLENAYIEVLPDIWSSLVEGSAVLVDQIESSATYSAQRHPEDGEIDWRWSAKSIHNFIRAQSAPYPGAFTIFRGERITFDRAALFDAPYACQPGQILLGKPEGVLVGCGESTALWVKEAHDENKNSDLSQIFAPEKGRYLR